MNCMHGIGHGFARRQAFAAYGLDPSTVTMPSCFSGTCLQDPSRIIFTRGDRDCNSGPEPWRYWCANGLYHSANEHFEFPGNWMGPCDWDINLPAYCFVYLFSDGLTQRWRLDEFVRQGYQLHTVCEHEHFDNERKIFWCINGLAAHGVATYIRTLNLAHSRPSEPVSRLCEEQAKTSFVPGAVSGRSVASELVFCDLVWGAINVQPAVLRDNIFDFCSFVTPVPNSSKGVTYTRWIACVAGAVGHRSEWLTPGYGINPCQPAYVPRGLNVTDVMEICDSSFRWQDDGGGEGSFSRFWRNISRVEPPGYASFDYGATAVNPRKVYSLDGLTYRADVTTWP